MSKEQDNQKENKVLHIGVVVRSFMEELGKGIEVLGSSIQKSGLLPHLIFVWCLVWGFIGLLYTLVRVFG
ncbi:MAG: hypothetical protein JXQ96_23395 [Cyclobacteriaceae bacterium]